MQMIDRYTSNEWVEPIIVEAQPILREFPQGEAREIAAAVLKLADIGDAITPWTTVFPSDDTSTVAANLVRVLYTPDYDTPAYNPDTHMAVEELRELLDAHEAVGMLGAHAAYHLVQAAAGKQDETFYTYQDKSRKWPQYTSEWPEQLTEQFGPNGYAAIMAIDDELPAIQAQIEDAADLHYQIKGSIAQTSETPTELIRRATDFFDIHTIDGLREASRILQRGLDGYRALAYQVRGLTPPSE